MLLQYFLQGCDRLPALSIGISQDFATHSFRHNGVHIYLFQKRPSRYPVLPSIYTQLRSFDKLKRTISRTIAFNG